jgi:TetR/AcrR family fatty acid metabolism transcriptional regulator
MTIKNRSNEKYYRIIDAATKIFAKKGFYQAKISEIAK